MYKSRSVLYLQCTLWENLRLVFCALLEKNLVRKGMCLRVMKGMPPSWYVAQLVAQLYIDFYLLL